MYYKGYVGYKDLVLLNSQLIRLHLSFHSMSWVDTSSEAVQPLEHLTVSFVYKVSVRLALLRDVDNLKASEEVCSLFN